MEKIKRKLKKFGYELIHPMGGGEVGSKKGEPSSTLTHVTFSPEGIYLSLIGFIPKNIWPRKFMNLSFPSGHSINGAISPANFSFCYVTASGG